jgi:type IV pilus assembly protein PilB
MDAQVKENNEDFEPDQTTPLPKAMRLGELLVREGFLKEEDVQKALAVQREESTLTDQPLGQILVKMDFISETQLEHLLEHPELKQAIGNLAVGKGLIDQKTLESCLEKKPPEKRTGEFLLDQGLLTLPDFQELLKDQLNAPRLGELAVQQNLISEKQIEIALRIQKSPRVLGEILCDLEMINPLDLHYVLNKYKKQYKLGEIIVKLGYVTEQDVNTALQEQKHSSESLGDVLIKKRLISIEKLQQALSIQSNIPFRKFEGFAYSEEDKKTLSGIISRKYAEKNLMLPVSLIGKDLTLALLKPEKIQIARELKGLYNYLSISCVLITQEKFSELFETLYSEKLGGVKAVQTEETEEEDGESEGVDFMQIELDEDMESGEDEAPIYDAQDLEAEELVNFIIKYGISNGASDIHIEQDRIGVKLRYRIDGVLRNVNIGWLKRKLQEKAGSIISRIKIISNLDIAERRLPQDGVFRINYYDKAKGQKADLDFRVATCKAITGENVVIRILDSRKASIGLENLNHSQHVLDPFKRLLKSSAGIILVTGPTGSGKSSTLYGALKHIYSPDIKIITAEDPIEYSFPGVMQTQVNQKINLTFARLLRSFLRLDPDVILVGEMRDEETSKIGFDAAQTGHLVLSTLHTNDSVSSISRLFDLGVERAQMASCLTCVLAQRLVRRICPSCVQEYVPEENEWFLLFDEYPSHLRFYRGKGCDACGFTGFSGRTLLSEVFVVDKEMAKALTSGISVDDLKVLALEVGMKTMLEDGLLKLRETTLSEIIRMIPHDMMQSFRKREKENKKQKKLAIAQAMSDGFVLSHDAEEQTVIEDMYQCFQQMKSKGDKGPTQIDRALFGKFVIESFREISRDYKCDQVIFNLSTNQGQIEISGLPVTTPTTPNEA